MAGKGKEKRMVFIPELKANLSKSLIEQGFSQADIDASLKVWEDGGEPVGYIQHGMFGVFRKIQSDIDGTPA